MRTFDALWIAYQADTAPTWRYEYKAVIDGQTYTGAEIWTFEKKGGLTTDALALGNCRIQTLTIDIVAKTGVAIAKNAQAEVFVRINGDDGPSTWYSLGVFFIDRRQTLHSKRIKLECLDRMAYADVPFLTDAEDLGDYPMLMTAAMTRIYTQLGTTLDARSTINAGYSIEYPNDMTMRQVLGQIASAHGGNFTITEDDKLRLVLPGYGTPVAAIDSGNAKRTLRMDNPTTFDSVAMVYTEEGAYLESGATTDHTLDVTNSWATQAICDAVAALIAGYTYTPCKAEKADLDPAIELGDTITIDGDSANIWTWAWDSRLFCDIECPSKADNDQSEFGFVGTLTQALSKKVSLGAPYFGASISRSQGLKIARSDGASEALFNSEVFAMRALEEGVMKDKLYFDPITGEYIFDGKLSATLIAALEAEFDVTISNITITNVLAAEKGYIAELTVDQLETSNKAQMYLANEGAGDTSDVDYIKIKDEYIEFITASTDGSAYEQATDRHGNLLYWRDASKDSVTTDVTAYPVRIFVYTEAVKLKIWFKEHDGLKVPFIELGSGSSLENPDRGKGFIFKDNTGLILRYVTQATGKEVEVQLGNEGFVDADMRRLKSAAIDRTAGTVKVLQEGKTTGDETEITFVEGSTSITYTWPDSFTTTISIV